MGSGPVELAHRRPPTVWNWQTVGVRPTIVRSPFVVLLPLVLLTASACGGDDHCPGGDVQDPANRLPPGDSAAEVATWDESPGSSELSRNTQTYRFEDDVAVIGEEGVVVPLADDFSVDGCTRPEEVDDVEDLMQARFGATFYFDPVSGELIRAACNGCA